MGIGIGEKIRQARQAKGWKIRDLARGLDTAESYVSNLECGGIPNPGWDRVVAIARLLEIPIETLFPENTEPAQGE